MGNYLLTLYVPKAPNFEFNYLNKLFQIWNLMFFCKILIRFCLFKKSMIQGTNFFFKVRIGCLKINRFSLKFFLVYRGLTASTFSYSFQKNTLHLIKKDHTRISWRLMQKKNTFSSIVIFLTMLYFMIPHYSSITTEINYRKNTTTAAGNW